jgi:hypothetical protein
MSSGESRVRQWANSYESSGFCVPVEKFNKTWFSMKSNAMGRDSLPQEWTPGTARDANGACGQLTFHPTDTDLEIGNRVNKAREKDRNHWLDQRRIGL